MSKTKKLMRIISAGILVWIVSWWAITYPIQANLAAKGMFKYMQEQGIKEENIKSMRVYKNHLFGGYILEVRLKDDPKFEYMYEYRPENEVFNIKKCKFSLTVYDETGAYYKKGNKNIPKYLPFDDDVTYYLK